MIRRPSLAEPMILPFTRVVRNRLVGRKGCKVRGASLASARTRMQTYDLERSSRVMLLQPGQSNCFFVDLSTAIDTSHVSLKTVHFNGDFSCGLTERTLMSEWDGAHPPAQAQPCFLRAVSPEEPRSRNGISMVRLTLRCFCALQSSFVLECLICF